jgi:hypothetical protein
MNRFTRIAMLMTLVAAVAAPGHTMGRNSRSAGDNAQEERRPDTDIGDADQAPDEVTGDTSDNAEAGDNGGAGLSGTGTETQTGTLPAPANDASINGVDATENGDVDGPDGGSPGTSGDAMGGSTGGGTGQ